MTSRRQQPIRDEHGIGIRGVHVQTMNRVVSHEDHVSRVAHQGVPLGPSQFEGARERAPLDVRVNFLDARRERRIYLDDDHERPDVSSNIPSSPFCENVLRAYRRNMDLSRRIAFKPFAPRGLDSSIRTRSIYVPQIAFRRYIFYTFSLDDDAGSAQTRFPRSPTSASCARRGVPRIDRNYAVVRFHGPDDVLCIAGLRYGHGGGGPRAPERVERTRAARIPLVPLRRRRRMNE